MFENDVGINLSHLPFLLSPLNLCLLRETNKMVPYSTGRWGKEKPSAAWIKMYYRCVNRVVIPPVSKTHA